MFPLHEKLYIQEPEKVSPFLVVLKEVKGFKDMSEAPSFDDRLKARFRCKDKSGKCDAVFWFYVAIQFDDAVKCHAFEVWQIKLVSQSVESDEDKQAFHNLVANSDEDSKSGPVVYLGAFRQIL